jgi:hypothetical protein
MPCSLWLRMRADVIQSTRTLLEQLAGGVAFDDREAWMHVIRRYGTAADAEALLDAFLVAPAERGWLLPIVQKRGTAATAARLFAMCADGDRLREGTPEDVLHCLGYLGHEPAETLLWRYATEGDHYESQSACLGLLDLPCRGLEVAAAIAAHEGKNLFPEFLPALAVKTGDPLWVPRLVRWGQDGASTDCNGGLLLGIAMLGARDDFLAVLRDPRWEADATATGSRTWAWAGTRVLGMGLEELQRELPLEMRVALLECWFRPIDLARAVEPTETARDLLATLFRWSTPDKDDSLRGLACEEFPDREHPIHDRLWELEQTLRLRAIHELEVQELRG